MTSAPYLDLKSELKIELKNAGRRFGEPWAVRGLDLAIEPGRIHAIVGENGAGKSTALKLMAGMLAPSEGQALVGGRPLDPATPAEAMARGVGLVHQHFMLIEPLKAVENVILGWEITTNDWLGRRLGRIDLGAARAKAEKVAADAGLVVPLDARTADLSVGEKQRLEILRVLCRGARALLLDEPTAVLSPVEATQLYATLRRLCERGSAIAVVTHRLDEVARFCDEVTAMRKGARVHQERIGQAERADPDLLSRLTRAVMGGEIGAPVEKTAAPEQAPVVLRLRGVKVATACGGDQLAGIDLSVRAGEVVGVAGVEGNGQRALATALSGLTPLSDGEIALAGQMLFTKENAGDPIARRIGRARLRGLYAVLDERHRDELVLGASVADNLVLGGLSKLTAPVEPTAERAMGPLVLQDERTVVARRLGRFAVDPADPRRLAAELSGGNQQKLVMARALDQPLRALVLAQPTRGVDVGTARVIRQAIAEAARAGVAVLVISADLDELRALSHRLLVIRKGAIAAELPPDASDEQIGRVMLGAAIDGAAA